jgi:magnesium-transporting ATPase (P-type)
MSWWAWVLIGIVAAIVLMCLAGYLILRYVVPSGDLALKSKRSMAMTKFWTQKIFWVNILALVLVGLNYAITNNLFPKFTVWIDLAIAILTAIGNAIGGGTQVAKLKGQLNTAVKKLASFSIQPK